MGNRFCCGERPGTDSHLDEGRAIYAAGEVVQYPEGVAAERLDEVELGMRNPNTISERAAVRTLLEAKGAAVKFQMLLEIIKSLPKDTMGKLDMVAILSAVHAAEDDFRWLGIEIYLCHVAAKTQQPGKEEGKMDTPRIGVSAKDPQSFQWLLLIDKEKQPDYKAAFCYNAGSVFAPSERNCVVM
eukprot:TRINITY_DN55166_c0_g1_i1.p1 TRINITY_DN55166_c0_g1~~TRINITY_DN55166_c0_g1_i1.p1  ORF type:complete len:185 (-),score=40.96 TRINITY_DN55166_c0_g1_i1:153-707(-)